MPKKAVAKKKNIPLLRPALPTTAQLGRYLRRIDKARWYSNFGPLQWELEARLAKHFHVKPENVALFANGTLALIHALQAMNKPRGTCLMPSWTFVATPAAALAAGFNLHFADVDPHNWALSPSVVQQRRDLFKFSAVVAVSPFGSPLDHAAWDAFTDRTRIPVLIDGAAAFDSVATQKGARIGKTPVMISLHATKCYGIGEGGLLLSKDAAFIARARQWGNFGFIETPTAALPGSNGKLSEYGAAIGLAALDRWPKRRREIVKITGAYLKALCKIHGVKLAPGFNHHYVSNSCNILTPVPASELAVRLAAEGIMTRRWWGDGCHAHPAYSNIPRDPLPVTDRLAKYALGLPFFHDLGTPGIKKTVTALTKALKS